MVAVNHLATADLLRELWIRHVEQKSGDFADRFAGVRRRRPRLAVNAGETRVGAWRRISSFPKSVAESGAFFPVRLKASEMQGN